uniref:CMP-N-acetylneuraminate-beta-galactosamide-alpha-2,3-sialyltransferase 2 n=1 Tax=Amphilophus citrinellus TaxID=61819 RepID=A0A3Q0S303_AMPCI
MIVRRNTCVAIVIAAILFLMIASQRIQRRYFLSQSGVPLSPLSGQAPPNQTPELIPPHLIKPEEREEDTEEEDVAKVMDSACPAIPRSDCCVSYCFRVCGCSDSCISGLNRSEWFKQRYNDAQQPILQDTGNTFDPDALSWWLSLQRSRNDQTLENVMSKMFQVIAPPTVDFKPLPSRCRSCAVVGNSGNLRHSGHGKLIDSHGFVFRMNKAVTKGFEEDVGNRTTHHFLYPESAVDIAHGISLVLLPFKLRDLEWLTSALSTGDIKMTYMRVKERVQADKDKVLVVNPTFFKYVHDRWTEQHGRYPSTGMLAIIFSLHACDQVSVFGYGADKQGNWHHYWEENQFAGAFKKTGVHSADFERQLIQKLASEGKITLYL